MRKNNAAFMAHRASPEEEREINSFNRQVCGADAPYEKIYYVPLGGSEYKARTVVDEPNESWEHASVVAIKSKTDLGRLPTPEELEYLKTLIFDENELVLEDSTGVNPAVVCTHLWSPVDKNMTREQAVEKLYNEYGVRIR